MALNSAFTKALTTARTRSYDAVPQADRDALTGAIATLKNEVNNKQATKASIEALQAAYDKFLQELS